MKVTKAIIPAAGFGTRMLPATAAIPKEMLTVVDRPVIQYVVEEAVSADITDILIIISEGKEAIRHHFNTPKKSIQHLRKKGKHQQADELERINGLANIQFIYQKEMKGLGDAILHGKAFAGDDPVAVLLGDSIIRSHTAKSILSQMNDLYAEHESSIIALTECDPNLIDRYGVMIGEEINKSGLYRSSSWVEKPEIGSVHSNLVVSGLYILTSTIFDFLQKGAVGYGGEIQLTDSIHQLAQKEAVYGYLYNGERLDIGRKEDFVMANLKLGAKNPLISSMLTKAVSKYLE